MVDTVTAYTEIEMDSQSKATRIFSKLIGSYEHRQRELHPANPNVRICPNRGKLFLYVTDTIGRQTRGSNIFLPASVENLIAGLEGMRKDAMRISGLDLPEIGTWRIKRVDFSTQWSIAEVPRSVIQAVYHSNKSRASHDMTISLEANGCSMSLGNRKSKLIRLYDKLREQESKSKGKQSSASNEIPNLVRFEVSLDKYAVKAVLREDQTVASLIDFCRSEWNAYMQAEWSRLTSNIEHVSMEECISLLKNEKGARQLSLLECYIALSVLGLQTYSSATDASPDTIRRRIQNLKDVGLPIGGMALPFPEALRTVSLPHNLNML